MSEFVLLHEENVWFHLGSFKKKKKKYKATLLIFKKPKQIHMSCSKHIHATHNDHTRASSVYSSLYSPQVKEHHVTSPEQASP